jgi:NADPH:quinone reductase-like Zn-dependent oxidoreductase
MDASAPAPEPGPGEVLVRVLASPLHPGDLQGVAAGGLEALDPPRSPGLEGVGVAEGLGPGGAGAEPVTGLEPGTRVAFFPVPGTLREYVTVPARFAVPVPDGVSDATAAVMLINTLTMRDLLRAAEDAWDGTPGPILQTAAGSSVGRLITAVAVRRGYRLVNVVRSEHGAATLRDRFPSVPVVTTADPGWTEQALSALGGRPRVVLDPIGGAFAARLLGLLDDGGTLVNYGSLSGEPLTLGPAALVFSEQRIRGVSVGRWAGDRTPDQQRSDLDFAVELARTRPELLDIAAAYDLADYKAAVTEVTRPGKVGTVLLTSPDARV